MFSIGKSTFMQTMNLLILSNLKQFQAVSAYSAERKLGYPSPLPIYKQKFLHSSFGFIRDQSGFRSTCLFTKSHPNFVSTYCHFILTYSHLIPVSKSYKTCVLQPLFTCWLFFVVRYFYEFRRCRANKNYSHSLYSCVRPNSKTHF